MITVRDHFKLASSAGGNVRSLGCSMHEHGRPVGLADPDGSAGANFDKKDFDLGAWKSSGWRPCLPCLFVLRRSGDLSEELKNPIPSRTRPLNSSAPMVLCLKTRESRSLPGLPRTNTSLFTISTHLAAPRRRVCICKPPGLQVRRLPSKPALKAHSLGFGGAKLARVDAGWSSPVARQAHNLKVTGSNPVPATTESENPRMAPPSRVFACLGPATPMTRIGFASSVLIEQRARMHARSPCRSASRSPSSPGVN